MPGYEVIGNEEFDQIKEIFEKSKILFRHGFDNLRNGIYKVREFEKDFANYFNIQDALAVSSGTAALKVALESLNIGEGDEVITQSFTFVATVEAIIESGAIPVITEIDRTLNMDPIDLESKITDKTKAIIVVHMLGVPARMDEIMSIARQKNIYVIEDTAWGCGAKLNGQHLGTIGDIGAFSFDFAKTLTTGEGGMVITKDKLILEKAKAYHDHGHENNPNLARWEDSRSCSGFNFRMSELQGAIGVAQLRKLPKILNEQRKNKNAIKEWIKNLSNIEFREIIEGAEETSDALIFFVENSEIALLCRKKLLENGIGTKILPEAITWHFANAWTHIPSLKNRNSNLINTFQKSSELLSRSVALPIFVNMDLSLPEKIYKSLQYVL